MKSRHLEGVAHIFGRNLALHWSYANGLWANADDGDPIPPVLFPFIPEIESAIAEIERGLGGARGPSRIDIRSLFERSWQLYQEAWLGTTHRNAIRIRDRSESEFAWEIMHPSTPTNAPEWEDLERGVWEYCDSLPPQLGICVKLGLYEGAISQIRGDLEWDNRSEDSGLKTPIQGLASLLTEARRRFPVLAKVDVGILREDYERSPEGDPNGYLGWVQKRARKLGRKIPDLLARLRPRDRKGGDRYCPQVDEVEVNVTEAGRIVLDRLFAVESPRS